MAARIPMRISRWPANIKRKDSGEYAYDWYKLSEATASQVARPLAIPVLSCEKYFPNVVFMKRVCQILREDTRVKSHYFGCIEKLLLWFAGLLTKVIGIKCIFLVWINIMGIKKSGQATPERFGSFVACPLLA